MGPEALLSVCVLKFLRNCTDELGYLLTILPILCIALLRLAIVGE